MSPGMVRLILPHHPHTTPHLISKQEGGEAESKVRRNGAMQNRKSQSTRRDVTWGPSSGPALLGIR